MKNERVKRGEREREKCKKRMKEREDPETNGRAESRRMERTETGEKGEEERETREGERSLRMSNRGEGTTICDPVTSAQTVSRH